MKKKVKKTEEVEEDKMITRWKARSNQWNKSEMNLKNTDLKRKMS